MTTPTLLALAALLGCASAEPADPPAAPAAPVEAAPTALKPGGSAGQTAPGFTAVDSAGTELALHALVKTGPVILVFYRGHW